MQKKPNYKKNNIVKMALSLAALSGVAHGGIIVTRGHIVGGIATGTLVAIDSPFIANANGTTGTFGGPSWTTGGNFFAHQADQGFAALSSPSGDGIREFDVGGTPWEPNGTPFSHARGYYIYPDGPSPGTTWTFNLATSGIDLPDGTIIHGVYARFGGRNNDRARYEYTEGASSANVIVDQFAVSSAADLSLRWFDSDGNPRDSNFQRIFSNPITVTGGDGFQLRVTDTTAGNAGHIDAIVLDTSLPKANDIPAISTLLPVDNKSSVVPWTSLEVTFDEPVALTGTGTVTITDLTDGSSTRVITLPDPQVTSPNGDDLLIKPTTRLEQGTQYSVKISADALVDLSPVANPFPGILDDTTWNFSTRAVPGTLHNVLIVTAALADAQPSATVAQATNLIFHDPRNVDEAMRAASYGQIGLNLGDFSGLPAGVSLTYPETVAQQKASGGSSNLKNRMAASLAAMGYNTSLANFRFILYIQPSAMNTGNDGWANLFSNTSVYLANPFNHRLAMHEMGHCLGGNHSNGGDAGCALGGADVDYNVSKKILYGWLSAFPGTVNILPANTGTTTTLAPLSRSPAVLSGTRAIRVPNPNGGTATYLVSYRINDGNYHTMTNAAFDRKIHVTEDAGGSATTHRAVLGAGQEYVVGRLRVRCDSIAADGLSATATISVNTAPVALAQTVTTNEDTATPITLTGTDADANPLTYTVLTQPSKGILSGVAPNLTYTPNANVNGADTFTFKVNDGFVDSATATISINVNAVNDLPLAIAQSLSTMEDSILPITLAGSDIEGSPLAFNIVAQPANGTLSGIAPNLTYTPAANFNGTDSFTFLVNDGTADSDTVTVAININAVNDVPIAAAQSITTMEDSAVAITIAGSDVDLDALAFTVHSSPANGTLSGIAPNLTYTPNANFNGTDSFTFLVHDGTADSAIATVAINVNAVNDVPLAAAQSFITDEDVALSITLTGSDVDLDPLTFSVQSPPANGTLSGTAPNLTYTPNANFNGADSFTFVVNDGTLDSAVATISLTLNPVNDAPVALSQSVSTAEDSAVAITLTGSDVDLDTLSFTIESQPANGTLSGTAPNLTFTPTANFNGSTSFNFKVNDGTVDSAIATIAISVSAVNDAPVFTMNPMILANATINAAYTGQSLAGKATDSDAADVITYSKVSGPAWLSVAANGDLSGTPPTGTTGVNAFVVRASDSASATVDATLEITVMALPLPWTTMDIGTGMLAGSASFNAGTYTQSGSGLMGGTSDKFRFSYQTITGDGSITLRISAMQNTGTNSRVGIMIRESLAPNSKHVFMGLTGSNAYRYTRRLTTGGTTSTNTSATGTLPNCWVLLSREGATIIAYKSTNGYQWNEVGRVTNTNFGNTCYIGLAVSSGSDTTLNTSQFSNVLVIP